MKKINWKKYFLVDPKYTKGSYLLRLVVGGYLVYNTMTMLDSPTTPLLIASILMGIAGIYLLISAGIGFLVKDES